MRCRASPTSIRRECSRLRFDSSSEHTKDTKETKDTKVPTAIDVSSVVGLIAVGMFTAQILLGLLLSTGYNPLRQWPRQRVKLFTFHNWLGYIGLATALIHPLILLLSSTAGFRLFDIFVPIWS